MHTYVLHEHVKTCPSCMNVENFDKGKLTTQKILALKLCSILDFHSEYYIPDIVNLSFRLPHTYIPGKNNCAGK